MNMSLTACPSSDRLREFVEGEIDEALVDDILRHLDVCAECRRKIENEPYQEAWAREIQTLATEQAQAPVDITVPLARLNQLLPDYEIISEIGRGGMGIVYHARQRKLDRDVALKVLPSLLAAFRPDARARFQREAALAAQLKHTSIIAIHDYGEVEGTLYYAMELVEGRSLSEMIEDLRTTRIARALTAGKDRSSDGTTSAPSSDFLTSDESLSDFLGLSRTSPPSDSALRRAYFFRIASWIADVAEGLAYAHAHSVTHRDIKPSNLLLTRDLRVMISDFGLARSTAMETITVGASLLGTARYMSPEQIDGTRGSSNHRVDVYALGATLYELLTMRPIYETKDDRKVLHQVLNDEPMPPRRVSPSIPTELETICLKALEKDPAVRYQTAQAFADDLRRWLLGLPILAKRQGVLVRSGKFVRRRKALVALMLSCGVLLIGGGWTLYAIRSARNSALRADATIRAQKIDLLLQQGQEQNKRGLLHQALNSTNEGLAIDPRSIEFMELKARSLTLLGRKKEALETLATLIEVFPDNWQGYYQAAVLLKSSKNMSTVTILETPLNMTDEERQSQYVKYRDKLAELHPDSPELLYLLAAEEKDPSRAIELLNRADENSPRLVEVLIARAHRYAQIGDFESMLHDADVLLAIRSGWGIAHSLRGDALNYLNRITESIEEYGQAIELEPGAAVNWFNRSMANSEIGRYESALADAQESLRREPEFSLGYAASARAKLGMGHATEAIKELTHGIQVSPGNIELVLERARLNVEFGFLNDGIADYTRSIELTPSDARGYIGRSRAYSSIGKTPRALDDLDRAAKLDEKNPSVYQQRAAVLAASGNHEAAIKDLDTAIAIRPKSIALYGDRANLNLLMHRYAEAIRDLTRILEAQPVGTDVMLMTRGMAHELSNNVALARIDYEKARSSAGPVSDYAALWLHILNRLDGKSDAAEEILNSEGMPDQGSTWTRRLISYFNGQINEYELTDETVTEVERCEASYYIGLKKIIEGQSSEGYALLKECAETRKIEILEVIFAQCRLEAYSSQAAIAR